MMRGLTVGIIPIFKIMLGIQSSKDNMLETHFWNKNISIHINTSIFIVVTPQAHKPYISIFEVICSANVVKVLFSSILVA